MVLAQPAFAIVFKQVAGVVNVALDQRKVRTLSQHDQRPGNDIDKTPCKFFKRGGVPCIAELPGDPTCYFRDPPKPPYRIVARRDIRPAQMKDMKLITAPGTLTLGVHPFQQVSIPFGVEHDHHISPANILSNQQLRQARLPYPGGAQHQ